MGRLNGRAALLKASKAVKIVLSVLAVAAVGVLFVAFGTTMPSSPFSATSLNRPTYVDSNGEVTAVVDTESCRALILDGTGALTGLVAATTLESPFDAITDVCVSGDVVYLLGVRFAPDSDQIELERVAKYDTGGNLRGIVYEKEGEGQTRPSLKSLSSVPGGFAVAVEMHIRQDTDASPTDNLAEHLGADDSNEEGSGVVFEVIDGTDANLKHGVAINDIAVHDATYSSKNNGHCAVLSVRGVLEDNVRFYDPKLFEGHVFTSIAIDDDGAVYACDDETGDLYVIEPSLTDARVLVEGDGYDCVHENGGVVSLCDSDEGVVKLCDASGVVSCEIREAKLSSGLFLRSLLVWASGAYLVVLLACLAIRMLYRKLKSGDVEGFAPMLLAVAVVSASALAIGNLTIDSYERVLESRANVVNMCADFIEKNNGSMSEAMERASDRDAVRSSEDQIGKVVGNLLGAAGPSLSLVESADQNNIGMYCALYGKDEQGVFYLYDSAYEYVMGTSAPASQDAEIVAAFEGQGASERSLLRGRTLRDISQHRLVRVPTADGTGVAGVIEIGIKLRTLDSFAIGRLARVVLALLVMMLVVYLVYSELRECVRCVFRNRQLRQADATEATALLTRPFTFAVTILSSIDSVMTVLIAQDLLQAGGAGGASPLLALPAVMLGVGLIAGQGLYGALSSRVGLRRLAACGALAMLCCACVAGCAVAFESFWGYCAAKLAMAVPFGMLYALGYSLAQLARSDEARAMAAGGVKRTDTSAAALGTVLGGYAAAAFGNVGVYVLIAIACLPVMLLVLNLMPKGARPLEAMARPDGGRGRIVEFLKTPAVIALALFILLPATVAAGYASFLFPIFSSDLGLLKADVNNIVVLGEVVVYACIGGIEQLEGRFGRWRVCLVAEALLGAVFLLFSVKTTLAWSVAVIVLVALLKKAADSWKGVWLEAANAADVPTGRAIGAMLATRSLALLVQPFVLGALLGATDSAAVTVIGLLCVASAVVFFFATRSTPLATRNVQRA